MNNHQQLLSGVSHLSKHYRELERISGANFNIFRIINVSSDELKHSSFVAELLNPKGSHGQGTVFLKLFVDTLGITPFHCDDAGVEIEKSIGKVTEEEGGRLDIYINDNRGNAVVIENKIYADDQPNQLIRYYQFIQNHKFNPQHVYYLTLDGKNATPKSTHCESLKLKSGEHYKTISYQSHIINWLELCRKEAAQLPLLREGISHYINLIKYLTGQSTNKAMSNEIRDLSMLNPQNLRATADIANTFLNTKHEVQWVFWKALRSALESKGIQLEDNPKNTATSERTWNYYYGKDKYFGLWCEIYNQKEMSIHWGCEIDDDVYFGFTLEKNGHGGISDKEDYMELQKMITNCDSSYHNSKYWLGMQESTPILNFRAFNSDAIFSLADKKELEKIVESIATKAVADIAVVKAKFEAL